MINIDLMLIYTIIIAIAYYIIVLYVVFRYMIFPVNQLYLEDNPKIKKEYFVMTDKKVNKDKYNQEKLEYSLIQQIDKVPSRKKSLTCIILRENLSSKILYIPFTLDSFVFEKCLYFVTNAHSCDNNAKLLVYLEGISLPFTCKNIERTRITKPYRDFFTGQIKERVIDVIKGLKYDGKILNTFADRKFAEIFTRPKSSFIEMILLFLGVGTIICSIVCIGVSYFYR